MYDSSHWRSQVRVDWLLSWLNLLAQRHSPWGPCGLLVREARWPPRLQASNPAMRNYEILQLSIHVHNNCTFQIGGPLESSQITLACSLSGPLMVKYYINMCASLVTYFEWRLIKMLYRNNLLCYFTPLIKVCARRLSSLLLRKCHLILQNWFITSKEGKQEGKLKLKQ